MGCYSSKIMFTNETEGINKDKQNNNTEEMVKKRR